MVAIRIKMDEKAMLRHKKPLEIITGQGSYGECVEVKINYKIDLTFGGAFIAKVMAVIKLMKDPDVSVDISDLNEERISLLTEASRALSGLVDAYYDKQIQGRRYGEERTYDF